MAEPLSPRAAAQAACPHLETFEAIESVSQRLTTRCDDCGKNLTNPETGTVWDELNRLRAVALPEGGEWSIERGHLLDDGHFCTCHGLGHAYRPDSARRIWRGPVEMGADDVAR